MPNGKGTPYGGVRKDRREKIKQTLRALPFPKGMPYGKGMAKPSGLCGKKGFAMNRIQLFAFVIASCIAVIVCLCFTIGSDSGAAPIDIKLESRVNPNNAPAAGLMMLPGVGPARAQAIISYREQFRQNGRGDLAFQDCIDLDNVKGIGPVTVSNMCEHLKFK